eukprot:g59892.t1
MEGLASHQEEYVECWPSTKDICVPAYHERTTSLLSSEEKVVQSRFRRQEREMKCHVPVTARPQGKGPDGQGGYGWWEKRGRRPLEAEDPNIQEELQAIDEGVGVLVELGVVREKTRLQNPLKNDELNNDKKQQIQPRKSKPGIKFHESFLQA